MMTFFIAAAFEVDSLSDARYKKLHPATRSPRWPVAVLS
jgi:hypothetical protein